MSQDRNFETHPGGDGMLHRGGFHLRKRKARKHTPDNQRRPQRTVPQDNIDGCRRHRAEAQDK